LKARAKARLPFKVGCSSNIIHSRHPKKVCRSPPPPLTRRRLLFAQSSKAGRPGVREKTSDCRVNTRGAPSALREEPRGMERRATTGGGGCTLDRLSRAGEAVPGRWMALSASPETEHLRRPRAFYPGVDHFFPSQGLLLSSHLNREAHDKTISRSSSTDPLTSRTQDYPRIGLESAWNRPGIGLGAAWDRLCLLYIGANKLIISGSYYKAVH
jgi:hypothetical protein